MLPAFKQYLLSLKLSHVSRKLYLSDVARFLHWLSASKAPSEVQPWLDEVGSAKSYAKYLASLRASATAPSMLKRTTASLRQFGTFLSLTYNISNPLLPAIASASAGPTTSDQYLKHFTNYLTSDHLSPLTIKSYKSDIARYLHWAETHLASTPIAQLLNESNRRIYLNHLHDSGSVIPSTIERKDKSLARFQAWYTNIYALTFISDNKISAPTQWFRSLGAPQHSQGEIGTFPSPDVNQNFVKNFNSRMALSFAVLALFVSTLGIFAYRQFSRDVRLTAAYPSTPVSPNRQLSFQGRLENASGTPITSATNLVFKLWDNETIGVDLYNSGVCAITPDTDGVFSTQIGATCGGGIDNSVFTEHPNVWLEVTVEDEVLTPRQQIATVAYALNSQTIQGFPLSSTVSAIRNTIVPMNQWGEIIVGEQSPRLTGVAGTFAISAPALTFTTTTGSSGNITLAPDGTGVVNVNGNTTSTNFFNVSNAQLTTGSLITGIASNNNTGFKLLDLLAGSTATSQFSVDAQGNVSFQGALKPGDSAGTSGQFLISAGDNNPPTWTSSVPASTVPFSGLTSSTNTSAAMVVGSGASLTFSGTGTINASTLLGGTWVAPGAIGSTTPNSGAFTTLTSSGDTTIGDAITDNITFTGRVAQDSDLIPITATGTNDLGTALLPWDNIYGGNFSGDGSGLTSVDATTLDTLDSLQFLRSDTSDNFTSGTLTTDAGTTLDVNGDLVVSDTNVAFDAANTTFTVTGALTVSTGTTGNASVVLPADAVGPNEVMTSGQSDEYCLTYETTGGTWEWQNCGSAASVAWSSLTSPTADLTLAMSTWNSLFNWDPGADTAETNFSLTTQGEDTTGGGDEDQVLLALSQTSNGVDVDQAADALLTFANNDANDPVVNAIRFDTGAAGTDFTYGINFDAASIGTAELILQNGETIDNNVNGAINLGATTLELTGGTTIHSDQTTVALLNTTTTTLNLGGSATSLELGATTGTTSINNALTVDADTTLGDAITDNITFTGRVAQDSDLIPITATGTNDLGTALLPWDNVYAVAFTQNGNLVCDAAGNNCPAGAGYWTRTAGNLYPTNLNDTISATTSAAVALTLTQTGAFNAVLVEDEAADATPFVIDQSGNVGIGDSGPDARLEILGTTEQLRLTYTDGTVDSRFTVDSSGDLTINNTGTQTIIADDLQIQGGDLTVDDTTFNLVNTTATTLNLGGAATTFNIGPTGSGASSILLSGGSGDTGCTVNGATGALTCSGDITTTATTGTQGWWQRLAGNLSPINLNDTISATTSAAVAMTLTQTGAFNALLVEDEVADATPFVIDQSGNVGIGDSGPDAKLEVLGTTEQLRLTYTDGTVDSRFTVDSSGNLTIDNTGTKTIITDDLQVTGGDILDSSGNESIRFGTTASAVNEATLTNAATGGIVTLAATGGDTDIEFSIDAKGADALNLNNNGTGDILIGGGAGSTGCTIANATGTLTCTVGITASSLKWNALTVPDGNLTLAMDADTTTFGWTPTGALDAWTMNLTNEGASATTQNAVIINNAVAGSFTDVATESLLLLQQLDTTTAGTTVVTNGLKIDVAGDAGMTNAITLTNSAGNLTTALNIADTAGGTLTTGINFSGTFTNELSLSNGETIDNIVNGTLNLGTTILKLTGGTSMVTDQTSFDLFNTTTTTLNLGGAATTFNIGPTGSGASSILLSGGSGDTGCTVNGATGALTCSGDITTTATTGTQGWWQRLAGNLSPVNLNDTISATTSAAVALTLTQTGAFNAVLVEDEAADATPFVIDQSGNVGIGVAVPTEKLEVNGTVVAQVFQDSSGATWYLDPGNGATSLAILGDINNTDGSNPFTISSTTNQNITIDAGSGTVEIGAAGAGKLDAGTIDPPYTINGSKFATYMAGMTGVKEETTGTVFSSEFVGGQGYRATLDLATSPEGSDLWLFSKTTNLKTQLDQLVVLLSGSGNTRTWYDLDPTSGQLYLYSSSPTSISYRLTAPRFDSMAWLNTRDSGSTGHVVNDDDPWSVSETITAVINQSKSQLGSLFDNVETNLISPLADNQPITINGPVRIQASSEAQTPPLASSGALLTIEGEIDASTISARTAILADIQADTITARNIVADTISANHIEGLDLKIDSSITDRIKARLALLTGNTPSAEDIPVPEGVSSTGDLANGQVGTAELGGDSLTGTASATLAAADIDFVTINDYLAVIGQATITTLDITGNLYTASIESKTGIINLASNTLIVDATGQVMVNGDLTVSGSITASELNLERLNVYDEGGSIVASIDASGSANLAQLTTGMITIASSSEASNSATPSGLLSSMTTSNATAGESKLISPGTELTIESPYITPNSLVYLTPTGNTDNKVLFVKSKDEHSFTVAIDTPATSDISFNWWIIQLGASAPN